MRPHRQQPTRLPRPWDSPGKNTGVGCHFPLQSMKVKIESEVAQSCPTLSNPMEPTRLPRPWDFPDKRTGVGCHCFLWSGALKITKTIRDKGAVCILPFSVLVSEPFDWTQNKAGEQTKSPADLWPDNCPVKPNLGQLNHSFPADTESENTCSFLKATEFEMVCYRALSQKELTNTYLKVI